MNYDKYGEVINGQQTYKSISDLLKVNETVGIGWCDEESTHLDIIFKLGIFKLGSFQRGLRPSYLYVSIIDHTSYGFVPDSIKEGDYIQTKLRMNNSCGDKLKELINGIIEELNKEDEQEEY